MALSDDHAHHGGLAQDLRILTRRRLFGLVAKSCAGLSLIPILANCATDNGDTADGGVDGGTTSDGGTASDGASAGSCTQVPEETGGPYPGDGTNGPNVLTESGVVRADIRSSFGSSTGTAAGVPLTVTMTLVSSTTCEPLANHAVYIWHCDRDGNYSLYSQGVTDQNYLRGVQVSDASGQVSFTTIFPACYSGRWPHIHFEVYPTVAAATSATGRVATSQLAMPKTICDTVYATTGYSQSVTNLAQVSLATDMVFSDGATLELPAVTGSVAAGYTAVITVAVAS